MGAISIAQLIYLIPVIFGLKQRQQFPWVKGVVIGEVITALVNGGCSLWFLLPK